jgi:hypothetical protein
MVKNSSRNLIAAGITIILAAGAIASMAAGAGADVVEVPPGQRRCVDSGPARNKASVNDFVMYGHKVTFVFLAKPDGSPDFIKIGDSGPNPVSSYAKTVTAQSDPKLFPGTFRNCVKNESQKSSTDSLTLAVQ